MSEKIEKEPNFHFSIGWILFFVFVLSILVLPFGLAAQENSGMVAAIIGTHLALGVVWVFAYLSVINQRFRYFLLAMASWGIVWLFFLSEVLGSFELVEPSFYIPFSFGLLCLLLALHGGHWSTRIIAVFAVPVYIWWITQHIIYFLR